MTWLVFALISVALTVTYSLISKRILNDEADHHPIAYASVLFSVVALYSLLFYVLTGVQVSDLQQLRSMDVLPWLVINIVCYTVAPSLYYRALKHMPISEVTILYSLTGLYAFIFGVLLGTESFVIPRLLGGLLIIGAVAAVTWKAGSWKSSKHVPMMVGATALYAIAAITDTHIIDRAYFSTLFFQALSFGVPTVLILLLNRGSWRHVSQIATKKTLPLIVMNGFFFFISFFAIYQAYNAGGETSQVSFAISSETIVMVVFAAVFLKERSNVALKIIAAVATVLGLVLIR